MKKIKKIFLFILLVYAGDNTLFAQDKPEKKYNTKKWIHSIGIGKANYWYVGVFPGRDEINVNSAGSTRVKQNKGKGFVFDAKLQYKLNKNLIGLTVNYYEDTYYTSGQADQTIWAIKQNKAKYLTIYDNHKYLNIGLNYERELVRFAKNRMSVNASLGMGYSQNLTPDRIEFDYNEDDYTTVAVDSNGTKLQHIYTDFKSGFFINPAVSFKCNASQNHGLVVELSWTTQWQRMVANYQSTGRMVGPYSYSPINKQYTVNGLQLKFNYFF